MSSKFIKYTLFIIGALIGGCVIFFCVIFPLRYVDKVEKYSSKYSLDVGLVAAVICVESRFDVYAVSNSGACGLMQIMPTTFVWLQSELNLGNVDILDPDINIESGCYYLRYLFDKYKETLYVLACYNAGEGVVSSWGDPDSFDIESIEYSETKAYVKKVLKLIEFYKWRFDNLLI